MQRTPHTYHRIRLLMQGAPLGRITQGLLILNAVWFVYMTAAGVSLYRPDPVLLVRFGALFGPMVYQGEIWRLLSCQFVHIGLMHIGFNMYVLYIFGKDLEILYGSWAFLLVYLFAGTCGALASLWAHPVGLSAGASGAIFGLAGAALAFHLRLRNPMLKSAFRRWRNSLLMFVGYNALFGLMIPAIDNYAHFGGLIAGFGMGLLVSSPEGDSQAQYLHLLLGLGAGLIILYSLARLLALPI